MRGGGAGCASRATRDTFRWNTRRAIAMRWALRCRPGLADIFLEPGTIRWRKSCGAMRGRMGHSLRPISRRDTGCRRRRRTDAAAVCTGGQVAGRRISSGRASSRVVRSRKCCSRSGGRAWPGCGGRSSRSSSAYSRDSPRAGRASPCRAAARRAPGCDRDAAGRRSAGVGAGARNSAGAHRRLPARRSGYADGVGRSDLGGRRADWRPRWADCALPGEVVAAAACRRAELRASDAAAFGARAKDHRSSRSSRARRFLRRSMPRAAADFPGETRDALWELVWSGRVTNDTYHPCGDLADAARSEAEPRRVCRTERPGSPEFLRRMRSRTPGANSTDGRWSLVTQHALPRETSITLTQWSANIAQQLLVAAWHRHARNGGRRKCAAADFLRFIRR